MHGFHGTPNALPKARSILLARRFTFVDLVAATGVIAFFWWLNLRMPDFNGFSGNAGWPFRWYYWMDVGPPFGTITVSAVLANAAVAFLCWSTALWLLTRRHPRRPSLPVTTLLISALIPFLFWLNLWPRETERTIYTGFPLTWIRTDFLLAEPNWIETKSLAKLFCNVLVGSLMAAGAIWKSQAASRHMGTVSLVPHGSPPNPPMQRTGFAGR